MKDVKSLFRIILYLKNCRYCHGDEVHCAWGLVILKQKNDLADCQLRRWNSAVEKDVKVKDGEVVAKLCPRRPDNGQISRISSAPDLRRSRCQHSYLSTVNLLLVSVYCRASLGPSKYLRTARLFWARVQFGVVFRSSMHGLPSPWLIYWPLRLGQEESLTHHRGVPARQSPAASCSAGETLAGGRSGSLWLRGAFALIPGSTD